jgi:hypothetical protein
MNAHDFKIVDKDDDIELDKLSEFLSDDTERKKKKAVRDIEEMGELFLGEIDKKKKNQKKLQEKLIPHILKKTKDKYSQEELESYSYDDVLKIYTEVKSQNGLFTKIFHFIFNI